MRLAAIGAFAAAASIVHAAPQGAAADAPGMLSLLGCTKISDDQERLQCFDTAMAGLMRPRAPKAGEPSDYWHVTEKTDPLTDEVVVTIMARGTSTGRRPVVFVARCTKGRTEAYVAFNDYLGDDVDGPYEEGKTVTYRVGTAEPRTNTWSLSTDKKAAFFPGRGGEFLARMLKGDRLVVQTTPYNENPVTAIFDTTKLPETLQGLADTCDWDLD